MKRTVLRRFENVTKADITPEKVVLEPSENQNILGDIKDNKNFVIALDPVQYATMEQSEANKERYKEVMNELNDRNVVASKKFDIPATGHDRDENYTGGQNMYTGKLILQEPDDDLITEGYRKKGRSSRLVERAESTDDGWTLLNKLLFNEMPNKNIVARPFVPIGKDVKAVTIAKEIGHQGYEAYQRLRSRKSKTYDNMLSASNADAKSSDEFAKGMRKSNDFEDGLDKTTLNDIGRLHWVYDERDAKTQDKYDYTTYAMMRYSRTNDTDIFIGLPTDNYEHARVVAEHFGLECKLITKDDPKYGNELLNNHYAYAAWIKVPEDFAFAPVMEKSFINKYGVDVSNKDGVWLSRKSRRLSSK